MWSMIKTHWIMSLIGLAILLTAVVSLIWAIATREGDIGSFRGSKGQVLKWETLPITCVYDPKNLDVGSIEMYDLVRQQINKHFTKPLLGGCVPWALEMEMPELVPRELVLRIGRPAEPEVGVVVYDPFESEAGGTTYLMEDTKGFVGAAQVWISEAQKDDQRVWLHELGHVLGLDHDRLKDSVMYKTLTDRGTRLSGKDIEHLREVYE